MGWEGKNMPSVRSAMKRPHPISLAHSPQQRQSVSRVRDPTQLDSRSLRPTNRRRSKRLVVSTTEEALSLDAPNGQEERQRSRNGGGKWPPCVPRFRKAGDVPTCPVPFRPLPSVAPARVPHGFTTSPFWPVRSSTTAVPVYLLSENGIYSSKPRRLGSNKRKAPRMACQLPIAITRPKRVVGNPANDTPAFLRTELSLGGLADMLKHLWFAGTERPATPLHFHIAMGREIAIADRMDLHLLGANKGRLFVKPIPRFLLDPVFVAATCSVLMATCVIILRQTRAEGSHGKSP
ncbi:hypothetical protein B0T18DRAFT_416303 [Schizothecium vesticola]|uniref:Uncharacterized protein n=1 Tax=Schizothecium vesticola TaxID=314040 RepID=A0AA40K2Y0_9PEZI|nr:hypothetical protein B0T18DRAFT_416303 [Schizothecium vesticola]